MTYGFAGSANAVSTSSLAVATYTVSATSLVITYVSTNNALSTYYDYSTSPSTLHAAGEKQIVTKTITYTK